MGWQLRLLPVLLLVLLLGRAQQRGSAADEQRFIGWLGEQAQSDAGGLHDHAATAGTEPWIETVSWAPRAFIWHSFLSHAECDQLRKEAVKRLSRSLVVSDDGKESKDPIRTSYSASLDFHESPVVMAIEDRIAAWTRLPLSHGEPIEWGRVHDVPSAQVLRYKQDQAYLAHWDWFGDTNTNDGAGDRVATVLMYLSDVPANAGGETALPLAEPLDPELQDTSQMSPCASRMGIAIRPRKGDALLFWDALPSGKEPDRRSLHASCPVLRTGVEKWTATKWLHGRAYLSPDVVEQRVRAKEELRRGAEQHE